MLDGNQQKQGEEGPPGAPEQTHPMGVERLGPLGHGDAHRLCPHPGQGLLSASTGHCRAWLGPHPLSALSHTQAHPSGTLSCTTGGGLLHSPCPERKCLHKSSAGRQLSELLHSDLLNLEVSHPPPAPPKILGDFSQTYPKTAMLPGTSSAGPEEKARHSFHPKDSIPRTQPE